MEKQFVLGYVFCFSEQGKLKKAYDYYEVNFLKTFRIAKNNESSSERNSKLTQ